MLFLIHFSDIKKVSEFSLLHLNPFLQFVFVDDKNLEETLRREMDESQLPEKYGGKLPLVPLDGASPLA